jgi:dienelactone hydrolase
VRAIGRLLVFANLALLAGCAATQTGQGLRHSAVTFFDSSRQRPVPVEIDMPMPSSVCSAQRRCPVAIISSGYGISAKDYTFIASALAERGFLVVAVQHELPTDDPLATQGDLFAGRTPNWQRGAANIRFVRDVMRRSHQGFDWDRPVLIGHSNGGDISAWLVRESPEFAASLITLDSRRVPLPRGPTPRMLSIRASDFQADAGVLPSALQLESSDSCIVKIENARHNDMHDGGPEELRDAIIDHIVDFLAGRRCKHSRD